MKEIEERAKELAANCEATNDDFGYGYRKGLEEGYIIGATKQRKIDIDKACEWFGQYLMEIGCPDDWFRDSPNMMSGEQRFRKAMEE